MMRIDWNGMIFETPCVTFYLWSRWRAAALEHRLYEVVQGLPRVKTESSPGEERAHITDPKSWQAALESVSRVLKGWQEAPPLPVSVRTLQGATSPAPVPPPVQHIWYRAKAQRLPQKSLHNASLAIKAVWFELFTLRPLNPQVRIRPTSAK